NALGAFEIRNLPVGDYQVRVDSASVPDSLRLVRIDSVRVRVPAADSVGVLVTLSFASVTVSAARALPAGRRVFVEGVTLNSLATFGDSTLHIADSTGSIRATRVLSGNVPAGTRVRVLGTTELRDGQPTLADGAVTQIASAVLPQPVPVSTRSGATANNGALDAALVQVTAAPIVGAATTPTGDFLISVNDGSGLLEVLIDRSTGINTAPFVPGAQLTATGVLATAGVGKWQLKPRAAADLTVGFATVTVAQARTTQVGRIVAVHGIALNSWFTFGDSTIHIADNTGTIRAVRVAPINLLAGDSVRLLGTVAARDGQPVLANVTASVLGQGVLPLPQVITTLLATGADVGRLDAALVKVLNATIASMTTVAGDVILTVNDGSGVLEVVLDRDVGFALGQIVVGARLDITGILVPNAGGLAWRLKPRQQSDLVVR
ncbi:MAG TPA: hypothetical protein VGC44_02605, partial [Longimicrobiales bacterium]